MQACVCNRYSTRLPDDMLINDFMALSCTLLCHPANCDPCPIVLRMRCYCDKEEKAVTCGALHPAKGTANKINLDTFLSCAKPCNKLLSCGIHRCEKPCHAGDCNACDVIRDKACYCGSVTKSEICGDATNTPKRQQCASFDDKSWEGEFSCGAPCDRQYDCGIHTENQLEHTVCHPHSTAQPLQCPRSPMLVTTCGCGKVFLGDMAGVPRTKCTDRIPSCQAICDRVFPACGHTCNRTCHEDECGDCHQSITVVCRCGNEKRTMECCQQQQQGEAELLCDRTCKALRACGRHECMRKCCPLAYQEGTQKARRRALPSEEGDPLGFHICDRVCGKMLNCGNHRCQQPDHKGKCPPCLQSSFEEISCHCGCVYSYFLQIMVS